MSSILLKFRTYYLSEMQIILGVILSSKCFKYNATLDMLPYKFLKKIPDDIILGSQYHYMQYPVILGLQYHYMQYPVISRCHFTKVLRAPFSVQNIPVWEPMYLLKALVKWHPDILVGSVDFTLSTPRYWNSFF